MLNSVVHAVTMEICVAISSSSIEGMVLSSIKMSMSIQHRLRTLELETLFCVLILLFSG